MSLRAPIAGSPLRVLGLDPGSRRTGYGLVEAYGETGRCIESGVLAPAVAELHQRIGAIFTELSAVIERSRPDVMAIEQVFVARSAESALKLGQARGAAIVAATSHGIPIVEYAARRVKQSVTGSGAASKDQMQRMVALLLNLAAPPSADAADALALALCHLQVERSPLRWSGAARRRGRWKRLPASAAGVGT